MLNRQMSVMSMQRIVVLYVEGYNQGLEDIRGHFLKKFSRVA